MQYTNVAGEADYVKMLRLDLSGDAKERGFAHGALLTHEIVRFIGPEMDKYIAQGVVSNLDFISKFPPKMQKVGWC